MHFNIFSYNPNASMDLPFLKKDTENKFYKQIIPNNFSDIMTLILSYYLDQFCLFIKFFFLFPPKNIIT